jgi:PAS domain S-box-containing protein
MRLNLQNKKEGIITLLAMVILAGCLALAISRLFDVEQDLRREDTHTNLWQISQTQYEAVLLAESLARVASGQTLANEEETPQFRLMLLISRMAVLIEGDQARVINRIGALGELKHAYLQAILAEPLVQSSIEPKVADQLRGQVRDMSYVLRDIANKVVVMNREEGAARRSMYLGIVFESFAFVVGIILSAAFLSLRVFKGFQETSQARQLLRQEQELSDLVINNVSNQGIVMFDDTLQCLLWNPGMEGMLSVKADQAIGRGLEDIDPLFAKPDVIRSLNQAIEGKSSIFEDEAVPDDEQERCLEINCFPVFMAQRKLGIAFVRDVTEHWQARKQAERQNFDLEIKILQRTAALRQAERRLIAAIESASDGFAAFDWTGKLLFANEQIWAAAPVALWCWEEMSLPVFLRCFAMCEGADIRLLAAEPPFKEIEVDLLIKKDTWARLSVTKADGATIFVRLTDITGYKQVANALQSALDRERETTNAYRNFVSMVSHQFRTPLAILDSSAQRILRRGPHLTADELSSRIQKIRNAGSRLTRLVESVLNAAKLDAGRIELNPDNCDLVHLVMDISERQTELNSHADIRFQVPDTSVQVYCDSMLIEQVVINLLSNAVKYSGDRPIVEIKVWMEGARAYCSVRDWGIGIPADELPKIFDRFYRARTASGIAGTGIGLNFAQRIMHLHGGDIQVESFEAGGSLFTFDLPLSNVDQAQQAA